MRILKIGDKLPPEKIITCSNCRTEYTIVDNDIESFNGLEFCHCPICGAEKCLTD